MDLTCKTIVVFVSLVMPATAYAYLDPGTGSMLLQLLLGGAAGLLVTLRLYWHKLLTLLGLKKGKEEGHGD